MIAMPINTVPCDPVIDFWSTVVAVLQLLYRGLPPRLPKHQCDMRLPACTLHHPLSMQG